MCRQSSSIGLYAWPNTYIVLYTSIYIGIIYKVYAWQRGLHEIFMMCWIVLFFTSSLVLDKRVLQTKCVYIVTSILYTHIVHVLVVYRYADKFIHGNISSENYMRKHKNILKFYYVFLFQVMTI